MGLTLLVANLVHGSIALLWAAGLRRTAGPLPADLQVQVLGVSLAMPVLVGTWRALELPGPPDGWRLVQLARWTDAILGAGTGVQLPLLLLIAGTTAIFLVQELVPALRSLGRVNAPAGRPDPALEAVVGRLVAAFRRESGRFGRLRPPLVERLETERPLAALTGFVRPRLLVSDGLVKRLDAAQLEAVLAHELAHLALGGNRVALLFWGLRAVQALSPPALVLGRQLIEAREAACDAVAARVTGRPAALASALIEVHRQGGPPTTRGLRPWERARVRLGEYSDETATRLRVRALLDRSPGVLASRSAGLGAALLLGGMLWSIG